jgi:hypothetical protein
MLGKMHLVTIFSEDADYMINGLEYPLISFLPPRCCGIKKARIAYFMANADAVLGCP